jgi:hypothetical protein
MYDTGVGNAFANPVIRGGAALVDDATRAKFVSEASLTTAMAGIHKAADLPHLTLNDKVFAARIKLGQPVAPGPAPAPPPAPKP